MKKMFRDLGSNYRNRGTKRKGNKKGGRVKGGRGALVKGRVKVVKVVKVRVKVRVKGGRVGEVLWRGRISRGAVTGSFC